MAIQQLNIKIIDTHENNRPLIIEDTQVESPHLVYNGQDDRFDVFFTSELQFNLLVNDRLDGRFFHLFTGSETRYKVVLENAETNEVIWVGFLLPEQFNEPYKGASFFVEFMATDGIARLKNKELSEDFYKEIKPIPAILAACLLQTGLELPIVISPAIKNEFLQQLKTDEIEINTACYQDDDKKMSSYDILEALVTSMGLKLFQYQQKWWLVGINRFVDGVLFLENYNKNGVLIGDSNYYRNSIAPKFLAGLNIDLNPSIQQMVVDWEKEERDNLFPLEASEFYFDSFPDPLPYHFTKYFADSFNTSATLRKGWDLNLGHITAEQFVFSLYTTQPTAEPDPNFYLRPSDFYLRIEGRVNNLEDIQQNYIELTEEVFVEKGREVTFELEVAVTSKNYLSAKEDLKNIYENEEEISNLFYYELYYTKAKGGERDVFITNVPREGFIHQNYNLKFSHSSTDDFGEYIKGKLKLERNKINKSGYFGLRLFPAVSQREITFSVRFQKLEFSVKGNSNEEIFLKRGIDFTTENSVSVFHGSDEMTLTNRNFLVNPKQPFEVDLSEPERILEGNIVVYDKQINTGDGESFALTVVTDLIVGEYIDSGFVPGLFIQKNGVGELFDLGRLGVVRSDGFLVFFQIYTLGGGYNEDYYVESNDKLFVKIPAKTAAASYNGYLYDKWSRVGFSDNQKYHKNLAQIYHDSLHRYNLKLQGTAKAIVFPLDLVNFNFKEDRVLMPVTIDVNLTEGQTTVDLVEVININVTDYEE